MSNPGTKTTQFAIEHPRLVSRAMLVITLVLIAGAGLPTLFPKTFGFLPQATVDTDPENMLPATDPVRVFHNENKERFRLHDAVVLGVVNEKDPNGVFNPETLKKVYELTEFAKTIDPVKFKAPKILDDLAKGKRRLLKRCHYKVDANGIRNR